jgi:hypothetical protein
LIFLVFGEKFPLEDLGFSRSMLASQQLYGVIKRHGRPDIFFALSSFAKDMECWNFGIMAIKLLAQHSYIPLFYHSNFFSSISALYPAGSRNFRIKAKKFRRAKK